MPAAPIPQVTVLLPVYNGARFLGQALASVFRQTFAGFELLVVDDGSTDDTPAVLAAWAKRDERLRVVRTGHGGIVAALATGLNEARAELVARMDADDVMHPRRLGLQVRYLAEQPEVAAAGTLVRSFPAHVVTEGYRAYEAWLNSLVEPADIAREIFVESPLAHPSVIMRRGAALDCGGYRDRGWPEDYDLWLRLWEKGHALGKVDALLHFWREGAGRLSRRDSRYSLENFHRVKAHFLARWPRVRQRPILVWGAGIAGRRLSKHLLREGVEIAAFVDIDPRKIGSTRRGRPIIGPEETAAHRGAFVVAAVGVPKARDEIRGELGRLGWGREGEAYVFAA